MPRPACLTGHRLHVTASFPGPGSYRVSPAVTCNVVLLCRALKNLWIDSGQAADSIEPTATPPVARLDCPQTLPVRFSRRQAASSQTTVAGNHLNRKEKMNLSTGGWEPNHYYFLSIFSLQDKKDKNTSFCLFPEQVRLCGARAGKDPRTLPSLAHSSVTPAQAGGQEVAFFWVPVPVPVPAFAGMTCFCGNDVLSRE